MLLGGGRAPAGYCTRCGGSTTLRRRDATRAGPVHLPDMTDDAADAVPHFEFPASIRVAPVDPGYMKHYVPLPPAIAEALNAAGARRLVGHIDGAAFSRAILKGHDGQPCLRFGKRWLVDAGLSSGDDVWVSITVDPDPDAVDVPPELEAALAEQPAARPRWNALSPGRRRSWAHHVDRAKRAPTRARRAAEVVATLLDTP